MLRYSLDTKTSDLWINSTDPGTPTLSDTTAATFSASVTYFNLRQGGSGNITGLDLDNLVVAQDFTTAVPEPATCTTITGLLIFGYGLWRAGIRRNRQ